MDNNLQIRAETAEDADAIHSLLEAAFAGTQEASLVRALRASPAYLEDLTCVACEGPEVLGMLMMTRCHVVSPDAEHEALALAPMAVQPGSQRQGIGSALVTHSLAHARMNGHQLAIVLGHPAYYPRFGFTPSAPQGIHCPFEVPDEVFMALWLQGSAVPGIRGTVRYAAPFAELG